MSLLWKKDKGGGMMERLTREMTFEEEYIILQKEVKELFDKEDRESEPPKSNSVVRRALRCIKKLIAELEPYKEYKVLEEQGLLLRLHCKVGDTIYYVADGKITEKHVIGFLYTNQLYIVTEEFNFNCPASVIGHALFITREEAEAKLKEMEGAE